jgi:hypothetical protein
MFIKVPTLENASLHMELGLVSQYGSKVLELGLYIVAH